MIYWKMSIGKDRQKCYYFMHKKVLENFMKSKKYANIDMIRTGKKIKAYIYDAGYTVNDIQRYLQLACPQPIYRWFKGRMLPSLEHLFMLSKLLGVHMEDLLVTKLDIIREYERTKECRRLYAYCRVLFCNGKNICRF